MLIAYADMVPQLGLQLSHTGPGLGSSSVLAPDTLPLSFATTPRIRQFTRLTTTASVNDLTPSYLTIRCSFVSSGTPVRLLGLFGHNLVESDDVSWNLYDDPFFTSFQQQVAFDSTMRLTSMPTWPTQPQMGYTVLPAGTVAGGIELTYREGFFRSGVPLQIGRLWISNGWEDDDVLGSNWAIDYVDRGDSVRTRNGSVTYNVRQRLRRFVGTLQAMTAAQAYGTGSYVTADGWYPVLRSVTNRTEFIVLPRPYETAMIRERMTVYGMTDEASAIQQVALGGDNEPRFLSALSVLERM